LRTFQLVEDFLNGLMPTISVVFDQSKGLGFALN